jgi:hypothetical protein
MQLLQNRTHAPAAIQDQGYSQGELIARKITDSLLDAVLVDPKILAPQVVDNATVLIANGRLDQDQIHIRLKPESVRPACRRKAVNGPGSRGGHQPLRLLRRNSRRIFRLAIGYCAWPAVRR